MRREYVLRQICRRAANIGCGFDDLKQCTGKILRHQRGMRCDAGKKLAWLKQCRVRHEAIHDA